MEKIIAAIGVIILALGMIFVWSLIMSLPVMWLWNWLLPTIFGFVKISWLQAWGVSFLSSLLFESSNSKS